MTTVETPAVSLDWGLDPTFDILIPLAVAVLAVLATWWVLGLRNSPHVSSRRSWLTILMGLLAILAVAATVDLINGTHVYPDCPQGAIPPGTACA